MAVTKAKFCCSPRLSLVLFGALATKASMAWAVLSIWAGSLRPAGPTRPMSSLGPCRLMR
eukprot:scaffold38122_cov64-Phaeocystis_antarctica.AAC.2